MRKQRRTARAAWWRRLDRKKGVGTRKGRDDPREPGSTCVRVVGTAAAAAAAAAVAMALADGWDATFAGVVDAAVGRDRRGRCTGSAVGTWSRAKSPACLEQIVRGSRCGGF
ncbi:hypothetical protein L1887_45997 [Cichorium endivia]|nr:hypothetical protein L1887_45997 [Cichorium endivia]